VIEVAVMKDIKSKNLRNCKIILFEAKLLWIFNFKVTIHMYLYNVNVFIFILVLNIQNNSECKYQLGTNYLKLKFDIN